MGLRDTKISVGTVFTVATMGGFLLYGYNVWQLGKNAQVQVAARVHKINWSGVELVVEGRVINPTSGSVRIKQPIIYLYGSQEARDNNNPFAASETSDRTFTIPPNESREIPPISITIPAGAILKLIAQGLLQNGELTLVINVRSTIYSRYPFISVPFKKDIVQKLAIPQNYQSGITSDNSYKDVVNKTEVFINQN